MSDLQYKRLLQCIVANLSGEGIDFASFRVEFRVTKGDSMTPNTANIRIYNLNDETVQQLVSSQMSKSEGFQRIQLSAGYEGNTGLIFTGTIKQVRVGREDQLNSYVDLACADADEAWMFAYINKSLAANSGPDEVHAMLAESFAAYPGTTTGYKPNFSTANSSRGQVFYGMTRNEARKFAKDQDCAWFFADGALTFIPVTGYLPGEIPVIAPDTGLIGTPEQTVQGVNFRCLLNPKIKVGSLVQLVATTNQLALNPTLGPGTNQNILANALLNTANRSGTYYVMRADHHGDTRGKPWYTDCLCLAADASVNTTNTSTLSGLFTTSSQDAIGTIPRF